MGKHDKKSGKGRLDKFYRLAKEQGYRARSAFKLIHLNRKYDLLSKSRCCIDLCAAPGGWLQVAEKYMPKGSLIIGVDLVPIKPLPHTITFTADITTPACRNELRTHMHDWKADLVLHDGAPNVGAAWVQDAFTQNELVLQSLKLACEFLKKGGNFVTKVFRSQDYNSLMWVFSQLFKHVEATKPPSSRNVSAEIFVVCRDFIAPKHIDPKFLDPKHVFKDVAQLPTSITEPESAAAPITQSATQAVNAVARLANNPHAESNVYNPEKSRRQRQGYADGDYTLFHKASAHDYVYGPDPVQILGTMNQIEFSTDEEKAWLKSRHTTPDVIANCADLKVLGKRDFKELMKWRLAIRLEIGLDVKANADDEATEEVEVEPIDEEEQITEELKRLHDEKMSKQKRDKKRKNEIKTRTIQKLKLGMTAPTDLDMDDRELEGEEMFDLGEGEREIARAGGRNLRDFVKDADGMSESEDDASGEIPVEEEDEGLSSDEERELRTQALEAGLDSMYDDYRERMQERDAKYKVKQQRLKDRNFDSWHGIREGSDSEDDSVDKGYRDQMVRVPRRGDNEEQEDYESEDGGWDIVAAQKAKLGEEPDSDDSSDDEAPAASKPKPKTKITIPDNARPLAPKPKRLTTTLAPDESRANMSRQAQVWFDQGVFKDVGDLAALDGPEDSNDEEMDEDDEDEDEDADSDVEMASDASESSLESTLDDEEEDEDDFEIVPQDIDDEPEWDVDDEDQDATLQEQIKKKGLLTAEAQTLANKLVNREITASQLMDQGFNRLSTYNKDGLPQWFLDDESKHYRPNIPITKEAITALRDRQRALDARPIKKVAEAKMRKKRVEHTRLERAKKKAAGVMETEDLNESEKARAVARLLRRAANTKKPERKVIVARGSNKGIQGRPKGVKGKYKIVDARMRKETRALKRIAKASKKKRR
ncbi:hypothetical protein CspeluHIS016_0306380 [Cutaneotrichosporon spelunceum]|uniref:AdoMet-dependent rRNA methyltransferase SPB1 n=1 Tax=Cutaneotrichosporon spelunceum TaxID=1672016 RepID=A0AAD3YC62_9TREE|nr:hypothetical protein CspeluHIS016_0306380 [Cutaneotrichosporon spelunceum]